MERGKGRERKRERVRESDRKRDKEWGRKKCTHENKKQKAKPQNEICRFPTRRKRFNEMEEMQRKKASCDGEINILKYTIFFVWIYEWNESDINGASLSIKFDVYISSLREKDWNGFNMKCSTFTLMLTSIVYHIDGNITHNCIIVVECESLEKSSFFWFDFCLASNRILFHSLSHWRISVKHIHAEMMNEYFNLKIMWTIGMVQPVNSVNEDWVCCLFKLVFKFFLNVVSPSIREVDKNEQNIFGKKKF